MIKDPDKKTFTVKKTHRLKCLVKISSVLIYRKKTILWQISMDHGKTVVKSAFLYMFVDNL